MDSATRELVRGRAADCCEYCGLPQSEVPFAAFHVEHIAETDVPDLNRLRARESFRQADPWGIIPFARWFAA
jgi:hypothetical protein